MDNVYKQGTAHAPILNVLIDDIAENLAHNAIKPRKDAIRALLVEKGITGAWEFGEVYNFKNPYKGFRRDYLKKVLQG